MYYFIWNITKYQSVSAKQKAFAEWVDSRFSYCLLCEKGLADMKAQIATEAERINEANKRGKPIEIRHHHHNEQYGSITAGHGEKHCFFLYYTAVKCTFVSQGLNESPEYVRLKD